ncbi:MAG TPA: glycosyltransferase [Gemmatimonadales bacterium]|nr:glycosyltransferase [Gemmatimonadales bacterium]
MSDARRLLVITYHFGPDGPVGGHRWWGITKYLARLGWKVSVITAARSSRTDESIDVQVERCPRLWTCLDGIRLVRRLALGLALRGAPHGSPAAHASKPPGLLRQLAREGAAWLAFPDQGRGWMLRAALRTRSMIRDFRPHVVVSSGPPHSAHLVAGLATLGTSARWLIDLRDPWAGPLPKLWESDPILGSRIFHMLSPPMERRALGAADGVITNTHQLADTLAAKYPDVPVVCVPNGVDPECLPPPARDPYPGLGIVHAGTLYAGRDVGPVVRALRIFFERHPDAAQTGSKLRVAGEADAGHARAFFNAVAAAGMERYVEVLGPLPRAEALNVVSRSRLAVVLAQQQELQIPAKLYESVAMGIPTLVVAPAISATGVEGNRIGAVVRDSDDVEGIACLFEHFWRNGPPERSPCPVPITYGAIAPLVDTLLTTTLPPP